MQLPDADQTIRCHRRTSVQPATERKILCVYPRYPAGFSTFQHSYALMPGIRAFMTPLGLLTIASYLPKEWQVRFVDENDRQADERDYAWADAVLISGMHVQRKHIQRINDTAHRFGKMTVLGGPSVSACPDYYPDVDILHLDVLELMREAWFTTVFCGVESPEPQTLRAIHKEHNLRKPIVDAIRTMNSYGLEVAGGVILGFDTDTPQTPDAVIDLVRETKIPLLTINLLYALPNSPLYNRLREEGRLVDDLDRESNIVYRLPHDVVLAGWRKCLQHVYSPPNLLERYAYQAEHTYPNRLPRPKVGLRYTLFGLRVIVRVLWRVGCLSDYRRDYLRVARPLVSSGRVAEALHIGFASYHLINFARDCASGGAEPSLYADPSRSSFNRSYTQD